MSPTTRRLHDLIAVQQAIIEAGLDPDEVMQLVVDGAAALLGADAAMVELLEGDEMVYRATTLESRQHLGLRLSVHDSLSGACVLARGLLQCEDTELDPRVDREACRRVGVRSMVVAPLLRPDGAVGVLKVVAGRPHGFDGNDVGLLQLLAGFIAAAIANAQDHASVRHRANHDTLTGLPNRALLHDRLDRALRRAARSGHDLTVLTLDLDGFKLVNDELGHEAGDTVLRIVGTRLQDNLRATDTVARVGGDEFVIVCEDLTSAQVDRLVARLRAVVSLPVTTTGGPTSVGASIGRVMATGRDELGDVLRRADAAMYADKRSLGRRAHMSLQVLPAPA